MADRYVYRLVVDQPATVWPTSCWRCYTDCTGINEADPLCGYCMLDLSPRLIGGRRRTFLSAGPVNRRARMIVNAGGQAHLERSEPVRWPA